MTRQPSTPDLVTRAYGALRDLIIAGTLAPGTRIIETELADRLGISRTPLRSALHRLRQEGWVTGPGDPGRHLRLSVSPMTEADARELYEIIGTLEGLAARWAASLPLEDRQRLTTELTAVNAEMRAEAAGPEPDPERIFHCHSAFHVGLIQGVDAPRLHALHAAIKPQSDRYRRIYRSALVPVAADAAAEQDGIIRAIRSGSPDEAEHCARSNWGNAAHRMCLIIRAEGEHGGG